MNKPSIVKLSSLKVGTQFYFAYPSLQYGVNDLTCFKKTAKGYTNGATRINTRSNRDADVVEAHSFTAWKNDQTLQVLAYFRKCEPSAHIFQAGQSIEVAGWKAYGMSNSSRPIDCVILRSPSGEMFNIHHSTFNACA